MKKLYYLIILFGTFMNAQNSNDSIVNMVKSQIQINLSKIPEGSEKLYGFDYRRDFRNCAVGKPIRVLTINQNNKVEELNQWRIPIVLSGNNKTLFTVQKINNNYEIVDIGGAELAKEIQAVEANSNSIKYLIRLYGLHIDFVSDTSVINTYNELKITPLTSAKDFLNSRNYPSTKTVFRLDELLEINTFKAE